MTDTAPVMRGDRKVYTVEAFTTRLRAYFERANEVWVEGEMSALNRTDVRGTVYFTLRGEKGACLDAWITRRRFDLLDPPPATGEVVQAFGALEFQRRGRLQFRASALERVGAGDHHAALERLRQKLAAEGLFAEERKRPLPPFPRVVGLLTGMKGAARGDVLRALGDRYPAITVVVLETLVTGVAAPSGLVAGLARLSAHPGVDVVIVARGGGSVDDLLAFSDERVVRAVAACPVPVVSAVGHEQDVTLCDLAADVRAPTPTAAGRLVVPDAAELRAALARSRERAQTGLRRHTARRRELIDARRDRMRLAIRGRVERDRTALETRRTRLSGAPRLLLERRRAVLDTCGARLQALSPASTLERGYAIVRHRGSALREAAVLTTGAVITVELARGELDAHVDTVRP